MSHKICNKCQIKQNVKNFNFRAGCKLRRGDCKKCASSYNKANYQKKRGKLLSQVKDYQLKNPDKQLAVILKKYKISLETYTSMLDGQNGKCKICGIKPEKRLAVDHCHTTGKVRAMLCAHCNLAVGNVKEDPIIAANLLEYIKQFKTPK